MKEKNTSPAFDRADAIITRCVRYVSYLGAIALSIIAIIATVDVAATKIFSHPLRNVTEFITYMNVPVVFFCIGFVQLDRGHTHIDILYRHFPPAGHKIIHIIGYLIGTVVCGFAGWRGIVMTLQRLESMTYASGPTSFLIWPFVACIGIGYLVLAISFLWCIPRELMGRSPYTIDMGGGDDAEKGE